ncbi:hypothetical protein Q4601_18870 [Shewanella sp. 1_MG-2023]|uniref:hypothetical protein n=1 Tax=unclassified Shewanella TaxID=196818 RepID=UPI0026E41743|nr:MULTISPECIES: hypothetical protein [unclassified Shewanella]MDO6611262.1 hypothetical protein [Shewanella sp. 7_MG-2023]MDO6771117.1 hypothetical protein [Shewanella sp. 2_MG-2023]MDO6796360.1 hypothetical protein [Shewanella sp. 1_MG-2023]
MGIKENLPKALVKLAGTLPITGHPTRENHVKSLERILELSVTTTRDILKERPELKDNGRELIETVRETNPELKQYLSAMPENYSKLLDNYEALQDERKIEAWADFREKLRLLLFRVLTAIGIASIILLTSFLAMIWGIPLPMRAGLQ